MSIKVFAHSGLKKIEEIEEGDSVLTNKGVHRAVKDVKKIKLENPVKIKLKRFDSIFLPPDQTVWVFDKELKWVNAKNMEKKMRMVVPLNEKYLKGVDDKFWNGFTYFEEFPDYALDIVRGVYELEMDFINWIRENNPKLGKVDEKYGEKYLKKYESMIKVDDEDETVSLKKNVREAMESYRYLKVKGDSYVTTSGTLRSSVDEEEDDDDEQENLKENDEFVIN